MGAEMNIDVITSFNQRYWDLIGHECVSTWLKHWPEDLVLTCYLEEMHLPSDPRIKCIDFSRLDQAFFDLQKDLGPSRALTFAKKAFSVIHAMHHSKADRLIWIDADVITKKSISKKLLTKLLPDHVVSTHLGVRYDSKKTGERGDWLVPETGIFALNLRHPDFAKFRDEYTRVYTQRDFKGLRRSYDNDVYGSVIQRYNLSSLDLCSGLKKEYKTPLKHTWLGDYLDHFKAKHSKDHFAAATQ